MIKTVCKTEQSKTESISPNIWDETRFLSTPVFFSVVMTALVTATTKGRGKEHRQEKKKKYHYLQMP